jgi:hypothetical protein
LDRLSGEMNGRNVADAHAGQEFSAQFEQGSLCVWNFRRCPYFPHHPLNHSISEGK